MKIDEPRHITQRRVELCLRAAQKEELFAQAEANGITGADMARAVGIIILDDVMALVKDEKAPLICGQRGKT